MASRIRLGDLLVRAGVLDEFKLNAALAEQKRWGGRLGRILVDMGFVSEDILVRALSKQLAIPVAQLDAIDVPPDIFAKVDPEFAQLNGLCPERLLPDRRTLAVAIADPLNLTALDEVSRQTGLRVEPRLAGEKALARLLRSLYSSGTGTGEVFLDSRGGVIGHVTSAPPALPASAMTELPPDDAESASEPTGSVPPVVDGSPSSLAAALESAQRKQRTAIRAMVDLLIEKGVFTRDEYLARVQRR